MNKKIKTPSVLVIAGFDTYGGAGLQVDIKTIHKLEGYAFSVASALTSQNSTGVKDVHKLSIHIIEKQLNTILEDIKIDAVKIGMLSNKKVIKLVAKTISKYKLKNIVLDTPLVSTSGKKLLKDEAIEIMIKELFPIVDLITPNIPEVNAFIKDKTYHGKKEEVLDTAKEFFKLGAKAVLLKGGHVESKKLTDFFVDNTGTIKKYSSKKVKTNHTHGTGCILSSAISINLAKGKSMNKSISLAKKFIYNSLILSSNINLNYVDKKLLRKENIL